MRARRGQVALYLLAVLVAVLVLVLMNVGTFLSVRTRNRTMNAGDAAALAVAGHQRDLLNTIGDLNVKHLKLVLDRTRALGASTTKSTAKRLAKLREQCLGLTAQQSWLCFLGPLDGIRIGNDWARKNGITEPDEEALAILRQHVLDIRTGYQMDLDQYPEPWKGAWEAYASALESAIGGGLYAAPDNIEFLYAEGGHLLLNAQFYNAIAGRNWCWFHFNAPGVVESYGGFGDWGPLPTADDEKRRHRCVNSEIYSLHLVPRMGSALMLFGREMIMALTGCSDQDISDSVLVTDQSQVWYFYDTSEYGYWRKWWEISPDPNEYNGDRGFPVVGTVKSEYDVRGCAAICRVKRRYANLLFDGRERMSRWTAAAKPFGTTLNEEGAVDVVTAWKGLVLPSFNAVRLVAIDSVGGNDTESPSLDMIDHIRNHLPPYLRDGIGTLRSGCYYCAQLIQWENPVLRAEARNWLMYNAKTCIRAAGSGGHRGGTAHGH